METLEAFETCADCLETSTDSDTEDDKTLQPICRAKLRETLLGPVFARACLTLASCLAKHGEGSEQRLLQGRTNGLAAAARFPWMTVRLANVTIDLSMSSLGRQGVCLFASVPTVFNELKRGIRDQFGPGFDTSIDITARRSSGRTSQASPQVRPCRSPEAAAVMSAFLANDGRGNLLTAEKTPLYGG